MKCFAYYLFFCWLVILPAAAQKPKLPLGLGSNTEPLLPAGLAPNEILNDKENEEPALPSGLFKENELTPSEELVVDSDTTRFLIKKLPFNLSGFWEMRGGTRVTNAQNERQTSIAETRLHLKLAQSFKNVQVNLTADLIYDNVASSHAVNLNTGRGFLDLREANLTFSPASFMDVRIGRQILTWGTGDLLFINDLFPKDWNALLIGRDEVYVKAPSDALKISLFNHLANLDIIYTPEFDADRFIDGRRFSYFSTSLGEIVGRNAIIRTDKPNDAELALRLYRNLGVYEAAFYFYDGYWKSPGGVDPTNGLAIFPKLQVTGASLRGPFWTGIGNIELGYYDSRDDRKGSNPFVNNSELRVLVGYEQEIVRNVSLGAQYYLEYMFDHNDYLRSLPNSFPERDEKRHLLTSRLTYLSHNQNVTWSLFSFFSPSDMDFYLRPKINYKISDHWITEVGGNIFGGKKDHTLLNQFQKNSNVYLSVRYGF